MRVIERYQKHLYAIAFNICRNQQDAEDVVQDTFIQYQSARAIRDAAKQKGGLAGLGAGAVVGRTVAKSMADSLDRPSGRKKQEPAEEKTVKKEPAKENPVNAGDIADKIGKYKKLLDEGVLTQEEFDEVKAMLLKEI